MSRSALAIAGVWLGATTLLNLAWEIAQLPLYTLYREATVGQIAFAIAHCTAGDVLIAGGAYAAAAVATRTVAWPLAKPGPGIAVAIALALGYTVFSEWLNVYVRQAWAYSSLMPQLFGIGVSPLAQWIVVPAAALMAIRRLRVPGG